MPTQKDAEKPLAAFISSTVLDLPDHRKAVTDACIRVGVSPVLPEQQEAGTQDPVAISRQLLQEADVYLAILGFRYGSILPGQEKSLTEIEYDLALAARIPRLIFLMSEDHPVRPTDVETGPGADRLRAFKAVVRREAIVSQFRSPDELKAAVVTALVQQRFESRRTEPATALLLLPHRDADRWLFYTLEEELLHRGVRVLRFDDKFRPGAAWANIVAEAIESADLVIVDVTDANPNVMYELGYVHALKKPTLLLVDSEELRTVPSDLEGFQFLAYERSRPDQLRLLLRRFLPEYLKEGR